VQVRGGSVTDIAGSELDPRDAAAARQDSAALASSAAEVVGHAPGRARSVLPMVLSDVPAAILLIDVARQEVTYANRRAVAMAADQRLPSPVEQWGAAAGLTDLTGQPLAASDNPFALLATGHPLAGEPVRAPGPEGIRTLWVTGFPLGGDEALTLVVLLEVATPPAPGDGEAALSELRDRAIIATDLAFTICDPRQEDTPLVWANPAFSRVTGYDLDEARGRNCRFLQGPGTDPAVVAELGEQIRAGRPVTRTLLNYRKDGTAFWNQLSISPVFDGQDRLVSFVGVQSDVTERTRAEADREQAFAAEQAARRDAEAARFRLGLLADAGVQLSSTLDAAENLERLADLVVPSFADAVLVNLLGPDGTVTRRVARHRSGQRELVERYSTAAGPRLEHEPLAQQAATSGQAVVLDEEGWERRRREEPSQIMELLWEMGGRSAVVAPLVARRREVLGTITFVAGRSGRSFADQEDVRVAVELGRRAGLTLDNARLYEQDHHTAMALQDSLLPDDPRVEGLEVGRSYLAGSEAVDVGGDWYEVLPLPDGTVDVAVGDVVGHDLAAAAAMGHLRGLLRAAAWMLAEDGRADPARVLGRVDRMVQGLHVVPIATVVLARLQRPGWQGAAAAGSSASSWRITWSSAGHPPMLVRFPDASVRQLDGGHGMLLGVARDAPRTSASLAVPTGSILLAFTDGLVERRGEALDEGLTRVAAALADADADTDMQRLVDDLVDKVEPDGSDDTAVIGIRLG
jgi:PAS domain S-box-containing protein